MSDQQLVLPFYVLADVSYSMTQTASQAVDGKSPLDQLNTVVLKVKDALDANPILSDKVRFSLIDFSDDARTQIPLCDLMKVDVAHVPVLVARGGTSFGAAFTAVRQQIDADVRQLKADGHKVHRPAVFFLTDGEPSDPDHEWQQAFGELTSSTFKARPNIIPFGVGDARKVILDQLVYPVGKMRSFVAKDAEPGEAIRAMAEILISSVIASANSISEDGETGGFVLPDDDEEEMWL